MAAARLQYLAQDRPEIAVASCVLALTMSRTRVGGEGRVRTFLTYRRSHPSCVLRFPSHPRKPPCILAVTGQDNISRNSTRGVVFLL